MSNVRKWALGAGAVATGTTVGLAPAAEAASSDGRIATVTSHYGTPAPAVVDRACPALPGALDSFAVRVEDAQGRDPADTLKGVSVDEFCIYAMPDQTLLYSGTETFTGSVEGCGSGSVVIAVAGRITALDAATSTRTNTGVWSIVPGSGTGELSSLRVGGGTLRSTVTAELADEGSLTGKAVC